MGDSAADSRSITILVASETGNSLEVGEDLQAAVASVCGRVRLIEAFDYDLDDLEHEDILLMVTSTQGEGEPPYGAEDLYDAVVLAKRTFSLQGVAFAVLGLGDSAYAENYNLMARQFDARYEQLGARRLFPHGECDFDYEEAASHWIAEIMPVLRRELADGEVMEQRVDQEQSTPAPAAGIATPKTAGSDAEPHAAKRSAANAGAPNTATLVERVLLTTPESDKEVYRIRLDLGEGSEYHPGDLLSIRYINGDDTVRRFLDDVFGEGGGEAHEKLFATLKHTRDITRLTPALIGRYAERYGNTELLRLVDDEAWLERYLAGRRPSALFRDYPPEGVGLTDDSVLSVFTSQNRRMYSISNAQCDSGTLVDLTLTKVEYDGWYGSAHDRGSDGMQEAVHGAHHVGECSRYMTTAAIGSRIEFALLSNERFRLPKDASRPIVMIALGSAIAPYRAFLQERSQNRKSYGKNWLMVGNRSPDEDFLYGQELEAYASSGLLSKFDTAWSRYGDIHEHVQDVMLRRGLELWHWIEAGACVYLCGHGRSAIDSIQQALVQVIGEHAGFTEEQAEEYVKSLKSSSRLQY